MKNTLLLIAFLFCTQWTFAQMQRDTGELFLEISSIITTMPAADGDEYADPSAAQLADWEEVLSQLLTGNYSTAATKANGLDYDLIAFWDTSQTPHRTFYVLKNNGANYWGTYVYYPDYTRPLVIQSPHPKKDLNTGKEGVFVFVKTEAFFFCLSGTNRCNHSVYSACSGTTTICGTSESYRISDMAHVNTSIFQQSTDFLMTANEKSHFIQLHGFSKRATDPYVILSNGTRIRPSPDYIDSLSKYLYQEDPELTFEMAHINTSWTRLIGFTNTQGRLINASTDVCNASATNSLGRFIHMEQERTRLRDTESGWDKVANALIKTFPSAPLPVSITPTPQASQITVFPNPTSGIVKLQMEQPLTATIWLYDAMGRVVDTQTLRSQKEGQLDIRSQVPAIYFLKIQAMNHLEERHFFILKQ